VKIQVGIRTGTVRLAVAVPARGISDTARFTVLPGTAVAIRFLPEDTAVYAGNSVQLRSAVVDRFENPRAEPVTHALLTGPATATAGGLVTATAIGAVRLKVTSGAMADTGGVSVVPVGTLAAVRLVDLGSIVVFNLDGTGYRQFQEVGGGGYDRNPVWSPDGTEIVFSNGDYDPMRLSALDLAGNLRRVIPSPPVGVVEEVAPEFSSDGAWIYFTEVGQASGVWRVHPDGSGGERISVGADIWDAHFWASPSPDGTRYSYFTNTGFGLKVFTLADSSISTWIVEGQRSRWSPLGNNIAFTIDRDGTVHLISPAGTGNRVVTPLTVYYDPTSLSWSPDAQWLAVRSPTSLELLNVQTGQRLPLGFTLNFYQPAWRP
jgi:Tol biopolymer transport system component